MCGSLIVLGVLSDSLARVIEEYLALFIPQGEDVYKCQKSAGHLL